MKEIEQANNQLNAVKDDLEAKATAVSRVKKEIHKLNKEVEGKGKVIAAKVLLFGILSLFLACLFS